MGGWLGRMNDNHVTMLSMKKLFFVSKVPRRDDKHVSPEVSMSSAGTIVNLEDNRQCY